MTRLTSEYFVNRTSELLRARGGADVTLSMVLEACDAQKGSLYHFFPGGKNELLAAAVEKMGAYAAADIQQCLEKCDTTAEAIQKHLRRVVRLLDKPDSPIGLPFVTLSATIGTVNEGVREKAEYAISTIESLYASGLIRDGFDTKDAKELATFSTFTVDGAIALSRARGNTKPLKLATAFLGEMFSRTRS